MSTPNPFPNYGDDDQNTYWSVAVDPARHDDAAWSRALDLLGHRPRIDGEGIPTRAQGADLKGRSWVYVVLDKNGLPTYIGSSMNVRDRLNARRAMVHDVGRYGWFAVQCASIEEARLLETLVLQTYLPLLNRRRAA